MENKPLDGLKIHARVLPDAQEREQQAKPAQSAQRKSRRHALERMKRLKRAKRRRTRQPLSLGDRLLRNTAVACVMLLGVLTIQNIDQPWSRLALQGVESALTMSINLDDSLGKLTFVRDLVPESALVFLNVSDKAAFAPVEGSVAHAYSPEQPWIAYQCAPSAEVRALEPGTVSAVTQLNSGDWGVLIDHGGGVESVCAYLGTVTVQVGESVSAGDVLGTAGKEDAPSVYFELRKDGAAIDPAERLGL